MAKNSNNKNAEQINPSLILSRSIVEEKIQERINFGKELLQLNINSIAELEELNQRKRKWDEYNNELLLRCFDTRTLAEAYMKAGGLGSLKINPTFADKLLSTVDIITRRISNLESLIERLELIPEKHTTEESGMPNKEKTNKVFIVHGHDDNAKISVARFVEKLGLEAIILHEQPNNGKTIIEKFESNARDVDYAIILLTPDDLASSINDPENKKFRARQNVILELGYFSGALGRKNICVLYKNGVEIPSDYLGVIYTELDSSEGWHLKLAKEMKTSGMNIDLNKVF
jgi:Predicted nucleotide-binding protein containing TIR -like domain